MKFTPRLLKENVNVSTTSPIKELFRLLGAITGGILLIYIVLGFALDILVERMPVRFEESLGGFFSKVHKLQGSASSAETEIQKLLDNLTQYLPEKYLNYTVHIVPGKNVNAVALPGGRILIYSALLEEVESENELSMVLAHELGHFVHRDHLRGLGRGLVFVFISSALFGVDSAVANFSRKMLTTAELKFSRRQEIAADILALELLYKRYGHVAGACDLFERLEAKRNLPRYLNFFSTHPYPVDRIKLLKAKIREQGYLEREKIPWQKFSLD